MFDETLNQYVETAHSCIEIRIETSYKTDSIFYTDHRGHSGLTVPRKDSNNYDQKYSCRHCGHDSRGST
jgi:hypothetical protein